ncbi:MAG: NADH pyrophosphatase zinc ribbon domain-containing protein, partial [Gimesia chilikensis]
MSRKLENPHSFRESEFEPHDSYDQRRSPIMAFYRDQLVIRPGGKFFHNFRDLGGLSAAEALFVGKVSSQAYYAIELLEIHDEFQSVHLREYLDEDYETFSIASRALQLIEWDRSHRFCGACGSETVRGASEWVRMCPSCGHRDYPR